MRPWMYSPLLFRMTKFYDQFTHCMRILNGTVDQVIYNQMKFLIHFISTDAMHFNRY